MAKSVKEQVEEDVKKAQNMRDRRMMQQDYERWIAEAARAKKDGDRKRFMSLAEERLTRLTKLGGPLTKADMKK